MFKWGLTWSVRCCFTLCCLRIDLDFFRLNCYRTAVNSVQVKSGNTEQNVMHKKGVEISSWMLKHKETIWHHQSSFEASILILGQIVGVLYCLDSRATAGGLCLLINAVHSYNWNRPPENCDRLVATGIDFVLKIDLLVKPPVLSLWFLKWQGNYAELWWQDHAQVANREENVNINKKTITNFLFAIKATRGKAYTGGSHCKT